MADPAIFSDIKSKICYIKHLCPYLSIFLVFPVCVLQKKLNFFSSIVPAVPWARGQTNPLPTTTNPLPTTNPKGPSNRTIIALILNHPSFWKGLARCFLTLAQEGFPEDRERGKMQQEVTFFPVHSMSTFLLLFLF